MSQILISKTNLPKKSKKKNIHITNNNENLNIYPTIVSLRSAVSELSKNVFVYEQLVYALFEVVHI